MKIPVCSWIVTEVGGKLQNCRQNRKYTEIGRRRLIAMVSWKRKQAKEQLNIKEKNGVVWLSFPALEESGLVNHSFSTRIGGASKGVFSSMNFSFSRGDDPEHVMENYRRMAAILDTAPENMVLSYQTHTTNVRRVTEADRGKGVVCPRDYQDIDGLITNIPGITLVTFYADCVPLYLLDPVHRAIGLSHSGWRGTVNRMGAKTLEAMRENYGTNPEDVIACIGPSICQDCFEVGGEVVEEFRKEFAKHWHDRLFQQEQVAVTSVAPCEGRVSRNYQKENGKYHLNLWLANEIIFEEAGVKTENIHTTDICTHCNPELLFSHRTAGNERGNLAAFFSLKEAK